MKQRKDYSQIQKYRTACRIEQGLKTIFLSQASQTTQTKNPAKTYRQFHGKHMRLKNSGKAQGRQIPLPGIPQKQLIHSPHNQGEENHSHSLPNGCPGIQIDQPINGKGIKKRRQKPHFPRTRQAGKRTVGHKGRGSIHTNQ